MDVVMSLIVCPVRGQYSARLITGVGPTRGDGRQDWNHGSPVMAALWINAVPCTATQRSLNRDIREAGRQISSLHCKVKIEW